MPQHMNKETLKPSAIFTSKKMEKLHEFLSQGTSRCPALVLVELRRIRQLHSILEKRRVRKKVSKNGGGGYIFFGRHLGGQNRGMTRHCSRNS